MQYQRGSNKTKRADALTDFVTQQNSHSKQAHLALRQAARRRRSSACPPSLLLRPEGGGQVTHHPRRHPRGTHMMVGGVEGVERPHREGLAAVSPAEQLEQRYNHNREERGARKKANVASLRRCGGEYGGVRGTHAQNRETPRNKRSREQRRGTQLVDWPRRSRKRSVREHQLGRSVKCARRSIRPHKNVNLQHPPATASPDRCELL